MPTAIEIFPTTNEPMADMAERFDRVDTLAKLLMGLKHRTTLVNAAREVDSLDWDWREPPRIERHWYAVGPDYNSAEIELLRGSLDGIGLRTVDPTEAEDAAFSVHPSPSAVMDKDGYWASSLVLRRWPREVSPGWLGTALGDDEVVDVGVHLWPQDPQRFARFLRRQSKWQSEVNQSKPDAANTLGIDDAERVRTKLIAGTDRPVKVAVVLTVRARERAELGDRIRAVSYRMGLALADVREARFEHDRGLEATSLTGRMNVGGAWRTLDCASVAATGIFQPATIQHPNGAPIGTSKGMLVKLDPFDPTLRTFGGLITGSVGSGKSFLLKLILMGLRGVETHVVEQSEPSEYGHIPGVQWHTLADTTERDQATQLREFVANLWAEARRNPRPRLLVLDELWSLIKRPELADLVEEIARRGRKFYLSLWIATQQIEELLESAKAVFDNAAIRIFLQQEDRDLSGLGRAARLSLPARRFLRGASRGQVLLYVNGMYVPVTAQATPEQYEMINTDPRERVAA